MGNDRKNPGEQAGGANTVDCAKDETLEKKGNIRPKRGGWQKSRKQKGGGATEGNLKKRRTPTGRPAEAYILLSLISYRGRPT